MKTLTSRMKLEVIIAILIIGSCGINTVTSQDSDLLPGLCYSPFRDGQSPNDQIFPTEEEIIEDLLHIKKLTHVIRTYGVDTVLFTIPFNCNTIGLDCWPGAWISSDTIANNEQLSRLKEIGQANLPLTKCLMVGNEVLLFDVLPVETMIQYINQVKQAVPGVSVSTSEPWHVWLNYPELVDVCDIICIHVHPYWENIAAESAADFVYQKKQAVQEAYPDKQVVITETGFPSSGDPNGVSVPTDANQALFFEELLELVPEDLFLFSFANEEWKINEGSVGPYWGLHYSNRKPKPAMQQFLSYSRIIFGSFDNVYVCRTDGLEMDSTITPSLYPNGPSTIRFSPNGELITYKANDGYHNIIDWKTHEIPYVFLGKQRSELDNVFDPAGNAIFYGAYFSGIYNFILKDNLNFPFCGTPNSTYPHEPVVSPDYKKVAYIIHSGEHNYQVFTRIRSDASNQTLVHSGSGSLYDEKLDLQWISNENLILKNKNLQKIYVTDTAGEFLEIDPGIHFSRICPSPNRKYLAVYGGVDNLHLLHIDSLPEVYMDDMRIKANLLAFSPNDDYLATLLDEKIRIFDFDGNEYEYLSDESFDGVVTLDWSFGKDTINNQIYTNIGDVIFNELRLYPNPCRYHINFTNCIDKVSLVNMNGECLKEVFNVSMLELSNYPGGLYLVRMKKDNIDHTVKLVKL